jgi:hypothetical protein
VTFAWTLVIRRSYQVKISDEGSCEDRSRVLASLAARREELRIVIQDLRVSTPPTFSALVALLVAAALLVTALALIVAVSFSHALPPIVSAVAPFLAVIAAVWTYHSFLYLDSQRMRRRVHRIMLDRATYLEGSAERLLKAAPQERSSATGEYIGPVAMVRRSDEPDLSSPRSTGGEGEHDASA